MGPAQVKKLMEQRSFKKVELLLVKSGDSDHKHMQAISGIYYEMPQKFNGRQCFQWVKTSGKSDRLACGPMYLHWSAGRTRWQIGVLGGDSNCVLFNTQDSP